jgi:hypothetical protein
MPGATLVVADDRHVARSLARVLARLARDGDRPVVLTGDPLLAFELRRNGQPARLTVDDIDPRCCLEHDRVALDSIRRAFGDDTPAWLSRLSLTYGSCLEYTLIPTFMRAVRHIAAVERALAGEVTTVVTVGTGDLTDAAVLVARAARVPLRRVDGVWWHRARLALKRVHAGRATRWVSTDLRALFLEPAFLLLMMVRGMWRRNNGGGSARALLVTGDRFTRVIIERWPHTVVLAGATQPGRALFRPGSRPVAIESAGRPGDAVRLLRDVLEGMQAARALRRDAGAAARLRFGTVTLWPLVRRNLMLHLIVWPPLLRHLVRLVDRVAAQMRVDHALVSQDVTAYNKTLVAAARAHVIPSVGLQHGMLAEYNGHSHVLVDTYAAWGPASERWFRTHGDPQRARFVSTGHLGFDRLAERRRSRTAGGADARTAPRPFTVVVCTGFLAEYSVGATDMDNLLLLEGVCAWAADRGDVRVVHKLHPGEEPAHYAAAARAFGWADSATTRVRDTPLYDLLEQSDVLVAYYSTTVLEAVALGTPAIVLDAITRRYLVPLDASPDIAVAFSVDELHAALDRVRRGAAVKETPDKDDAWRGEFLEQYLGPLDGSAVDRVVELVSPAPQRVHS